MGEMGVLIGSRRSRTTAYFVTKTDFATGIWRCRPNDPAGIAGVSAFATFYKPGSARGRLEAPNQLRLHT